MSNAYFSRDGAGRNSRSWEEETVNELISNGYCSICGVNLNHENNQPFDSISQVVWAKLGIPETQVLMFCKYCINRRKEGLIKGLEYLKEEL